LLPPAGLTGWWPGDGNINDIVGGRQAELHENAGFAAGLVDEAFNLDGSADFVSVPHDSALDLGTSDFTVDLWVYFNDTEGEQVLIEKLIQVWPYASGWTLTKLPSNVIRFAVADSNPSDPVEIYADSNVLPIPTRTWIHFAVTRQSSDTTVYMDGEQIAESSFRPPINLDSHSSLKLGHRGNPIDTPGSDDWLGAYLNGRIDEVDLFVGRALTHEEIQAIFDAGTTGKCKEHPSGAETYLLPVVAYQLPGHAGNLWSSELYLKNGSPEEVTVTLGGLALGRRVPPEPCPTFAPVTRVVPPHSTVLWPAAQLGPDIGCATLALGALILDTTGPIDISSRLVNHRSQLPETPLPLHGTGQIVNAIALDDLPSAGDYLLPALMWHRNSCGPEEFVTSVGFANPAEHLVRVTLDLPPMLAEAGMRVNGESVELPYVVEVPGQSWVQVRLAPVPSPLTVCMPPEIFDLWIDTDAPVAIYGSVVDRLVQDPRTVLPIVRE
jgi:hypothetical protein